MRRLIYGAVVITAGLVATSACAASANTDNSYYPSGSYGNRGWTENSAVTPVTGDHPAVKLTNPSESNCVLSVQATSGRNRTHVTCE